MTEEDKASPINRLSELIDRRLSTTDSVDSNDKKTGSIDRTDRPNRRKKEKGTSDGSVNLSIDACVDRCTIYT